MLKLVSFLCCALAVAEGGALLAPLAYSTTVVAPGTTSISQSASSVVHPSPYALSYPYGAPLAYTHLLKKRSAPLLTYSYPYSAYSSYYAPSVLSSWTVPAVAAAVPAVPAVPAVTYAHLIKKRSAALIAPVALPAATSYQSRIDIKNTAPLAYTSTYAAPYAYASPYYGLGYGGYPYLY